MAGLVVRFRIDFGEDASVGPGKIGLLEAIRDAGSLSQAARDVGMSYRRAWLLVDSLKQSFREPVTLASKRGMHVSAFGETLIEQYRELERDFAALAERRLQPITARAIRHARDAARRGRKGDLRDR
jgi:molybdate transport system regulatory protein